MSAPSEAKLDGLVLALQRNGTILAEAASAEITRLRAEVARKDDALDRIMNIYRRNFGRQDEKLADIEPIARAARMPAEGRAALEQEGE